MSDQLNIQFQRQQKVEKCPHCGHVKRLYTRRLNHNMCFALIQLYKLNTRDYVHLEKHILSLGHQRCGDQSFLTHYKLIEGLKEDRKDGSSRNGNYRITSQGIMFCEMKIKCPEKFIISENKLVGFTGKQVYITECLGKHFDYDQLMKDAVILTPLIQTETDGK